MSMTYKCPKCTHDVLVGQITPRSGATPMHQPVWICGRCQQTTPRNGWGLASDQTPAADVAFYDGLGKKEVRGQGLFRAIVRKDTFAAGNYGNIRQANVLDVSNTVGTARDVAIYSRAERFMLRGQFYTPTRTDGPSKVVLLLSGSGGVSAVQFAKVVPRYLSRVGVSVLRIDYRGYGKSDRKTPSAKGLYTDAQAMFSFLTQDRDQGGLGYQANDVVIHGYSLGTGVAADLARSLGVGYAGLILQCPFQSAAKMGETDGRDKAGAFGAAVAKGIMSAGTKMEVEDKIAGVTKPILLLIANQDVGMKADGDAIEARYTANTNLTVGRYDGEHLMPENAFKVGGKVAVSMTGKAYGGNPIAGVGGSVKKDLNLPDAWDNVKTSKGVGCLGVINTYYGSL